MGGCQTFSFAFPDFSAACFCACIQRVVQNPCFGIGAFESSQCVFNVCPLAFAAGDVPGISFLQRAASAAFRLRARLSAFGEVGRGVGVKGVGGSYMRATRIAFRASVVITTCSFTMIKFEIRDHA